MAQPSASLTHCISLFNYGVPSIELASENQVSSLPTESLDSLCQSLSEELNNSSITFSNIYKLIHDIVTFQNSTWRAKHSLYGVPCKIPSRLLLNLERGCALEAIIRHLSRQAPGIQFGRALVDATSFPPIAAVVLRPPFFNFPKIHISDNCMDKQELERIATQFGATLADSTSATHFIVPGSTISSEHIQVTPIEYSKSMRAVFVHFHGTSHSNDAWVSETTLRDFSDASLLPRTPNRSSSLLNPDYLLRLQSSGEWMPEEDYLEPKEIRSNVSAVFYLPKSKKRPYPESTGQEHQPNAIHRVSNDIASSGLLNKLHSGSAAKKSGSFGILTQPSLRLEDSLGPSPSLFLPHHTEWFKMDEVHEIERRALPEFFVDRPARSSNKSADIYREYRDFMIHAYQQNPSHYLNYTSCRRSLAGDACAVLRVFDFLESVGLINYAVNPDVHGVFPTTPSLPPPSEPVRQSLRLDNPPSVPTASGLLSFAFAPLNSLSLHEFRRHSSGMKPPIGILPDEDVKPTLSHGTTEHCPRCQHPLGMAFFQHASEPSTRICHSCISSVGSTSLKHFHLVDKRSSVLREADELPWSDAEILCLLDGLEKFGDDFDKVSEYVQSRDKASCILQFLRLPIDEMFWDGALPSDRLRRELNSAGASQSPSSNSLLQLSSFITRTISPKVAAAAARAAIEAYLAENPSIQDSMPSSTSSSVQDPQSSISSSLAQDMQTSSNSGPLHDAGEPQSDLASRNPLELDIVRAVGAAVAASALKATLLAEKEERDARKIVQQLVDAQLKKIELKMKYFDEMERFLEEEHKKLDALRSSVLEEKWRMTEEKRMAAQD